VLQSRDLILKCRISSCPCPAHPVNIVGKSNNFVLQMSVLVSQLINLVFKHVLQFRWNLRHRQSSWHFIQSLFKVPYFVVLLVYLPTQTHNFASHSLQLDIRVSQLPFQLHHYFWLLNFLLFVCSSHSPSRRLGLLSFFNPNIFQSSLEHSLGCLGLAFN
jgi:hypothetical protein